MIEITYLELFIIITVLWILFRAFIGIKNKKFSFSREAQLLLVYICLVVITRVVDFPWHHVNGKIDTMKFDSSRIIPLWLNLVPVIHLFDIYDGWMMNIIGNIALFIPVGIIWPFCFKKLNTIRKTVLAGFVYTLSIEISQLFFYERCSDIDDLILNTTGCLIGALIYFGCRKIKDKQ